MEQAAGHAEAKNGGSGGPGRLSGVEMSLGGVNQAQVHPEPPSTGVRPKAMSSLGDHPLDDKDSHLVGDGEGQYKKSVVKALRERRERLYSHAEIQGPVKGGKISLCKRISYAAPSLSTVPLAIVISVYTIAFYEKVNANLEVIAAFQAVKGAIDVMSDPISSYWTDSCRSKMGRRRPFLLAGCIPYAVFLILLLYPLPSLSVTGSQGTSTELSVWFGVFYILFYLMQTITVIPYDALGPEVTDDPQDRAKLFMACTVFDGIGSLLAVLLPTALPYMIESSFRPMNTKSCDVAKPGGRNGNNTIDLSECTSDLLMTQLSDRMRCLQWDVPWNSTEQIPRMGGLTDLKDRNRVCDHNLYDSDCFDQVKRWNNTNTSEAYCKCIDECEAINDIDNQRFGFALVGFFFGAWYVISMLNLFFQIKERSMTEGGKKLPPPPPMVPSMLNTFNNKPFMTLLPAWICDNFSMAILQSLIVYFVRYIVQAEFRNGCNEGEIQAKSIFQRWHCKSDYVLGLCVVFLLVGAVISAPLWYWAHLKIGKRRAWLLMSLTSALTTILFVAVKPGDYWACIIIASLNGIPFGAKFLADAILADVIDYDEFLTGARSEATYLMFKSFLPKIAAIPASAVPYALLSTFGHVGPVDGKYQCQVQGGEYPYGKDDLGPYPDTIGGGGCMINYLYVVGCVIPSMFSLAAFFLKARYPILTEKQNDLVNSGIGHHLLGKPAACPISGVVYDVRELHGAELDESYQLNNFMGVDSAKRAYEDPIKAGNRMWYTALAYLVIFMLWVAAGLAWFFGSSRLLVNPCDNNTVNCVDVMAPASPNSSGAVQLDPTGWCGQVSKEGCADLSVVPVLGMVFLGIGLTLLLLAILRFRGVRWLHNFPVDSAIAKKVLRQRLMIREIKKYTNTSLILGLRHFFGCATWEEPERRACRSATQLEDASLARDEFNKAVSPRPLETRRSSTKQPKASRSKEGW